MSDPTYQPKVHMENGGDQLTVEKAGEVEVNSEAVVAGVPQEFKATFDFAVQGGAIGAHGLGVFLPDKAVIVDGFYDVLSAFHSAGADAGTIAIHIESANDLVAAIAINDGSNPWGAGLHPIIPVGTAATMKKTTQRRELTVTVAGQPLTAGKMVIVVRYAVTA